MANGKQASLISDQGFAYGSGGYIGRIEKLAATHLDKPTISGWKSRAELASAAGTNFKMVDMVNIPQAARQKDARLLDGTSHGWFQDNRQAGGVHHYRKDVDADEFRMFKKTTNNSDTLSLSCGDICIGEIPKGAAAFLYSSMKNGKSTFTPAECPTGGCQ